MLTNEISRNPSTESEKQINRVFWIFRTLGVSGEKLGHRFVDFLQSEEKEKKPRKKGPSAVQDNPDYVVHLSQKPE